MIIISVRLGCVCLSMKLGSWDTIQKSDWIQRKLLSMPKELNKELLHIFLSKTTLENSMVDPNMTAKESKLLIIFISTVFSWLSCGLTNRTPRDFGVTAWISHTMYGVGLIFFRVQMALVVKLCKFPLTSHVCTVLSLRVGSICSSVIPLAATGRCFKPFWK